MQPNNQPFDPGYLDTIATTQQQKTLNPFILWGLIAAVLIALVAVVMMGLNMNSTPTGKLTTLAAQLANLEEVTSKTQENLKSSQLRTTNSSLTLVLTNTNRDLEPILAAEKIKLTNKKDSKIVAVNKETEAQKERIEDARLNGVIDRTYAREISFSLKNIRAEIASLAKSSSSKSLKESLQKADASLKPLLESYSSFKPE